MDRMMNVMVLIVVGLGALQARGQFYSKLKGA